jgi:hypothetical protein
MVACYGYDSTPSKKLYWVDPKWGVYENYVFSDFFDGVFASNGGMEFFKTGQW